MDDVEGWKVEYSIAPEGSARIVDGARGVEDGEDLYFGVKNQIGYAVETVLANGEELTADTITDNEDGSQTAWYAVYGVTEEQSIDVVMARRASIRRLSRPLLWMTECRSASRQKQQSASCRCGSYG